MNKQNKRKTVIKLIVFGVLVFLLVEVMGALLLPYDSEETRQAKTFYSFPENTVDVLIIGASTVRNGISPNELWNQYGIVAYTRANSRQPAEITDLNLKETLEYQDPKVLILSLNQLFTDYDYDENEPFVRKGFDYKKFSLTKLKGIFEISEQYEDKNIESFLFPVLRYHSRWNDISLDEFKKKFFPNHDFRRGQIHVGEVKKNKPLDLSATDSTVPEVDEESAAMYKETISYAKEQGMSVLIVTMPDVRWTLGEHLASEAFAAECGADYIDFNTNEMADTIGLDWTKDLYDEHHLNLVGTRKATEYAGQYLIDHYSVPQYECSEETAKLLDEDWKIYNRTYKRFYKKTYSKS